MKTFNDYLEAVHQTPERSQSYIVEVLIFNHPQEPDSEIIKIIENNGVIIRKRQWTKTSSLLDIKISQNKLIKTLKELQDYLRIDKVQGKEVRFQDRLDHNHLYKVLAWGDKPQEEWNFKKQKNELGETVRKGIEE